MHRWIKSDLTRVRHLQNSTRVQLNACRNPEDMIVRFAIQQLSTPATCIARNACTGVLYCAHGKSDDHVFRISAECLTLVRSLLAYAGTPGRSSVLFPQNRANERPLSVDIPFVHCPEIASSEYAVTATTLGSLAQYAMSWPEVSPRSGRPIASRRPF